jgi:hypothetical protein
MTQAASLGLAEIGRLARAGQVSADGTSPSSVAGIDPWPSLV